MREPPIRILYLGNDPAPSETLESLIKERGNITFRRALDAEEAFRSPDNSSNGFNRIQRRGGGYWRNG